MSHFSHFDRSLRDGNEENSRIFHDGDDSEISMFNSPLKREHIDCNRDSLTPGPELHHVNTCSNATIKKSSISNESGKMLDYWSLGINLFQYDDQGSAFGNDDSPVKKSQFILPNSSGEFSLRNKHRQEFGLEESTPSATLRHSWSNNVDPFFSTPHMHLGDKLFELDSPKNNNFLNSRSRFDEPVFDEIRYPSSIGQSTSNLPLHQSIRNIPCNDIDKRATDISFQSNDYDNGAFRSLFHRPELSLESRTMGLEPFPNGSSNSVEKSELSTPKFISEPILFPNRNSEKLRSRNNVPPTQPLSKSATGINNQTGSSYGRTSLLDSNQIKLRSSNPDRQLLSIDTTSNDIVLSSITSSLDSISLTSSNSQPQSTIAAKNSESGIVNPNSNRQELVESPSVKLACKEFYRVYRQKEKESLNSAQEYARAEVDKVNPKMAWRVHLELAEIAKRLNDFCEVSCSQCISITSSITVCKFFYVYIYISILLYYFHRLYFLFYFSLFIEWI